MLTMRSERSVAVLWATHLYDEVPEADRMILLHRGKVLADTTAAQFITNAGTATIEQAFLAMTEDCKA
jgi:ABC-2 type transport system ATP-binding protein